MNTIHLKDTAEVEIDRSKTLGFFCIEKKNKTEI